MNIAVNLSNYFCAKKLSDKKKKEKNKGEKEVQNQMKPYSGFKSKILYTQSACYYHVFRTFWEGGGCISGQFGNFSIKIHSSGKSKKKKKI